MMASQPLQERLERIIRDFGADSGTIHVLEGGALVMKACAGIPESVQQLVARVPIGKGMAGLAVFRNAPVTSCNIQTDRTGDVRPGATATGLSGALVVPIRDAENKAHGAIGIGVRREHTYTEAETQRLLAAAAALVPLLQPS